MKLRFDLFYKKIHLPGKKPGWIEFNTVASVVLKFLKLRKTISKQQPGKYSMTQLCHIILK
jgi:hypothetical protein